MGDRTDGRCEDERKEHGHGGEHSRRLVRFRDCREGRGRPRYRETGVETFVSAVTKRTQRCHRTLTGTYPDKNGDETTPGTPTPRLLRAVLVTDGTLVLGTKTVRNERSRRLPSPFQYTKGQRKIEILETHPVPLPPCWMTPSLNIPDPSSLCTEPLLSNE